jgi:hypothetical protein
MWFNTSLSDADFVLSPRPDTEQCKEKYDTVVTLGELAF